VLLPLGAGEVRTGALPMLPPAADDVVLMMWSGERS
jgi:hypothetical protein